MEKMRYEDSYISKEILKATKEMGFEYMSPIQELTIPRLMEGQDVIGQAQTGTGKTAAFAIPMIEKINIKDKTVQGIVLCPTRELAVQAAEQFKMLAKYVKGVKVLAVYGGQDIERQIRGIKEGANIIIGTPGRVMDHMRRRTLKLDNLKLLVLDEADEMLNMGFREDIETICATLPIERQTLLYSATMSDEIKEIAKTYQNNAKYLRVEQDELTIPLVKQAYYVVQGSKKDTVLCRLIDYYAPKKAIIFCNTKKKVDELTLLLKGRSYYAEGLHGDLSQHQRDRVMNLFKNGTLELLLATDVAARGIDARGVDVVFNYDMPQDMEYYVHRIGRTGRAGKKGNSYSIITPREKYKIDSLEDFCKAKIEKLELPTAASVNRSKAHKVMNSALVFCEKEELSPFMKLIYNKCLEEQKDVLEVAAAILRMNMGELLDELSDEVRSDRPRERRSNRSRSSRDGGNRNNKGHKGSKDNRKSKDNSDHKKSGKDDKHRKKNDSKASKKSHKKVEHRDNKNHDKGKRKK